MIHDPDFHAAQAYFGLPRGLNHEFDLFLLYNGGIARDEPLLIGELDREVQRTMQWGTNKIYASWDFAQKVRFKHEISLSLFATAQYIVETGNIFRELSRGGGKTVVFTKLLRDDQPYLFYMPCRIDRAHHGIFAKTIYLRQLRRTDWRKIDLLQARRS
jgi:hypothetical protein